MDVIHSLRNWSGVLPQSAMRSMVYVDFANMPIDDSFRQTALLTARDMFRKNVGQADFFEENGSGRLRTEWKRVRVGGATGILFKGEFEYDGSGCGKIEFIIDDMKLGSLDEILGEGSFDYL